MISVFLFCILNDRNNNYIYTVKPVLSHLWNKEKVAL